MNPIYKAQYDAEIEKLEAMESAWAGMLAAEAEQAEAKPKRKRKAKAVNLVTGVE